MSFCESISERRSFLISSMGMLSGVLLAGCSLNNGANPSTASTATQPQQHSPAPAPLLSSSPSADLTASLTKLAAGAKSQLTLSLYEYPTKSHPQGVQYNFRPEYQSYEASLAKVPIALSVLRLLSERGQELSDDIYSLLDESLGYSDNDATQELFSMLGEDEDQKGKYLNGTYQKLGITRTHSEGDWGVNLTNAQDQVIIARAVNEGVRWINDEQLQSVREIMKATDESQTWGVGVSIEDLGADYVLCKNGWIQDENTAQWYVNELAPKSWTSLILNNQNTKSLAPILHRSQAL